VTDDSTGGEIIVERYDLAPVDFRKAAQSSEFKAAVADFERESKGQQVTVVRWWDLPPGFALAGTGNYRFMSENATDLPREDDRNEELPDSPAPDPEEGSQGAEDDPQAD
jgi:hypothetical protein